MNGEANSPYFDHAAEKRVVGILLVEPQPRVQDVLDELEPDMFHDMPAASVIKAMKQLRAARRGVDLVTVNDQLSKNGDAGALDYAVDAAGDWTPPTQIGEYVNIIRQCHMRRQLRILSGNITYASADATQDPNAILTDARTRLANIAENFKPAQEQRDGSVLAVAVRAMSALQEQAAGRLKPLKTGFNELDKLTGGFFGGEILVIGARPGTGKTAIALELTRRFLEAGKAGLFASLEMSDTQLANRMIAAYGGINGMRLRQAETLTENEWDAIADAVGYIGNQRLWISERVRTVDQLRNDLLKAREKWGGLDFAVVDYIQLMGGNSTSGRMANRNQEVGKISRELKILAVEQNIVLIVLSQLNREGTERPTINQLRESGQIEQDADMIMLLYSPQKADDVRPQEMVEQWRRMTAHGSRLVECILAKARNGMNGVTLLEFVPGLMRYLPIGG